MVPGKPLPALTPRWTEERTPQGGLYACVVLAEQADPLLFERAGRVLAASLAPARWARKLDGLDQRYWELEADGGRGSPEPAAGAPPGPRAHVDRGVGPGNGAAHQPLPPELGDEEKGPELINHKENLS